MSILTRWHPFRDLGFEMRRFQHEMDRLMTRRGYELPTWPMGETSYPLVNLWEDNDFVHAEVELPGQRLDDLTITVTGGNQLTLKGKRGQTVAEKVEWLRQERTFGDFERVIPLPVAVDPAKVEARLEHGVLTIKMAKSEAAKPRKIVVKAE